MTFLRSRSSMRCNFVTNRFARGAVTYPSCFFLAFVPRSLLDFVFSPACFRCLRGDLLALGSRKLGGARLTAYFAAFARKFGAFLCCHGGSAHFPKCYSGWGFLHTSSVHHQPLVKQSTKCSFLLPFIRLSSILRLGDI